METACDLNKQKHTVDIPDNMRDKLGMRKLIIGNFQISHDALLTSQWTYIQIDDGNVFL